MKKYFIAFFAVAIAVVAFAFTTNAKKETCLDQLYYFSVNSSTLTCAQINNVSQLILPSDAGIPNDPAGDVLFTFRSSQPFGCADQTTIACALGYTRDQIEVNAQGKWQPKAAQVASPVCCVKKTATP